MAAAQAPSTAEMATASRPASQSDTSPSKGPPCSGSRPVQFGTAVNRKPAMAATAKPNSISCACHVSGVKAVGIAKTPAISASQSPRPSTAESPARKKNGRKP